MKIDEILKEIKERCDAATEGPWKSWNNSFDDVWPSLIQFEKIGNSEAQCVAIVDGKEISMEMTDKQFITHARTDVPMLLEMVEVLREVFNKSHENKFTHIVDTELEKIAEKYK